MTRTKRFLLLLGVMCCCAAMAFAQGVDDPSKVFQLEGNVITDQSICFLLNANGAFTSAPSGGSCASGTLVTFAGGTEDWDKIANGTTSALAKSYISPITSPAEAINSNADSIFTGGGSKDISGIASWNWKNGKPQGKDDIEHAFAAAYSLPGVVNGANTACGGQGQPVCDVAIYFGMTRFDNSGDATAGFWFVQDGTVGFAGGTLNANKDPICSVGSGCPFSGHHTNNDLLIVSDFSTGGPITSIQIFKWSCSGVGAACDSSGSLVAVAPAATNECNPVTHVSSFCAVANGTAGLNVPFGFNNKSGQSTLDHGELLEGGVNLNVIFGGQVPCFSTFFAETRSSNSPTATLSDVTPPTSFPLCGISATKACSGASVNSNDTITYNFGGTITNTGIGTVTGLSVSDTPGKKADGTVVYPACVGPVAGNATQCWGNLTLNQPATTTLGAGASTTYSGHFDTNFVAPTTFPNVAVASSSAGGNTITASGDWSGTVGQGACAPVPQAGLSLTKGCTTTVTSGNPIEVTVNITGTLTNSCTGAGCVDVSAITVTDTPSTTITIDCSQTPAGTTCTGSNGSLFLSPGASANLSGSIANATCTVTQTNTGGRCIFSDTLNASGTGALGTGTITALPAPATCSLCPDGTCAAAGSN